ncbi:MAG: MATE family efflux transporter, partial [Firmicutes bacterium]|nr:MATE family efflux transporter [Bacillota bacterium]
IPSGIQGMVFSIANRSIQTGVNSLGADVMAGSSAAYTLEIMVYFLVNAFGQACVSFTSQNYGAANYSRCRKVFKVSLGLELLFTVAASMLMLLFGRPLLGFFNSNEAVITAGFIRLKFLMTTEVFNALVEMFSVAMRGLGQSMKNAIISIVGICGVRILWVNTVFKAHHTIGVVMLAYPVSWAITSAVLGIIYFFVAKKTLPVK